MVNQKKPMRLCMLHLFIPFLLFSSVSIAGSQKEKDEKTFPSEILSVGAILDLSSRAGKEEIVAMRMAMDDHFKYPTDHHCKQHLHVRDSGAASASASAKELITEEQVGVILDLRKWDEVALVAEPVNGAQVPILSFAETIPVWASRRWRYLLEGKRSQYKEMDAVAAIVGSWRWPKVNFIYEDINSATSTVLPYLVDALGEVGSNIDNMLALPPLASLYEDLEKLQSKQCRVFIVHTSFALAKMLFLEAKNMGLMGNDSVWITTTSITDHLNFLNASVISSMQGVLGVKTYYTQSGTQYKDFSSRFHARFHLEYPGEVSLEPGTFALQAYDAIHAVAIATRAVKDSKPSANPGQELLENILRSNFKGLAGQFYYVKDALAPSNIFRIVNVGGSGTSYRGLGFWSEDVGFSRNIVNKKSSADYKLSMTTLRQVIWPGSAWTVPRRRALTTDAKTLMIGVPESPTFNQFVNIKYDVGSKPSFGGYAIDVFNLVLGSLPYDLPHDFIPYNGSYDSLVKQIYYKKFDAVVGDVSIVANRYDFAEFSQPWTDSGLQMVVLKNSRANNAWLFFKPFTVGMWGLTAIVNIYNGYVVWLMERSHHAEFNGSPWNRVGAFTWLTFTTLFSLHGDRLHSNLSRITMVVWLFVAIIIIQSYTASLSSMLTIPRIEPNRITLEYLMKSNAKVGCDGGSFVVNYLKELGIDRRNINTYELYTDYPQALASGEILAAFLEVPYIKILLAQHCRHFAVKGPIYKVGGFGFVFPKGSPILPDISKAVLELSEKGKLLELENALLYSYNCSESKSDDDSLGVSSFWGLFVITGGTTTATLLLYLFRSFMRSRRLAIHATSVSEHHPDADEQEMFASEIQINTDHNRAR